MRPFLTILALLACAGTAVADEAADLRRDHKLLEAEMRLARGGQLYIIFDLIEHRVSFRSSGVTLVQLPLVRPHLDGPLPPASTLLLASRETKDPPRRETIHIPENDIDNEEPVIARNEDVGEFQALELADMPDRYRLVLADGTTLDIGPARSGLGTCIGRIGHGFLDLFGTPDTARLQLALAPDDARQLYWSFAENAPCLIRVSTSP